MLPDRVRVFNKYVTNRVLRGLAHLPRGPFALVRHVGRRSSKPYETEIMAFPTGDGFIIALTYGPNVDWYRNLVAAGGGTVLWHRKEFAVGNPEPIAAKAALPYFPPPIRLILSRTGLHDFVRVKGVEAGRERSREVNESLGSPPKTARERVEEG